jgi:hypothetical protein
MSMPSFRFRGPVFIVGAPRSGTTLLQYMLRSHPALSLPTGESHFFVPLYHNATQYGDLSDISNVRRVLQAMKAQSAEFLYTDLHGMNFDVETLAHEFVAEGRATVRDIISGLFEKNARGEGKPRWGDKTPYYVLHIPKLVEWWPDAQIIHIIRDGRDVALSMFARARDFHVYNTYQAAKLWEQYVEAGHAFGISLPSRQYLEFRYEDMLSDQESTLRAICAFLDLDYSDDLLDFKTAGQAGKTPLLQKPIQKGNQDKWRSEMAVAQIRVFESGASETLMKFGYALTTDGHRLPLFRRALYRWHNALATWLARRFGPRKKPWTQPLPS